MTVYMKNSRTVLARVSHVKYLQMGLLWDWLAPYIPLLLAMHTYFSPRPLTNEPEELIDKLCGDHLVVSNESGRKNFSIATAKGKLLNGFGAVHGGAVCMLLEKVALLSQPTLDKAKSIKHMEVSFLSPCYEKSLLMVSPMVMLQEGNAKIDLCAPKKNKDGIEVSRTILVQSFVSF